MHHLHIMNRLSIVKKMDALQMPVFTRQQFAAAFGTDSDYAAVLLSRMTSDGALVRVMRGKYCLPETDIRCIASALFPPSFVSLWKAFEYYGTTTQMPRITDVISTKRSRVIPVELETGSYKIRLINTHPSKIFGFTKIRIDGKVAFIAEKERAIIDGLQYSNYVPLDEVFSTVSDGIEPDKAINFAKRIGMQAVMKRMGYLLERGGYECSPKDFGKLSKTYVPLDPQMPKRGKHDSKWRIIANTVIE